MQECAKEIRQLYQKHEQHEYGREWTDEEIAMGLVGDIGDLLKPIQAKNGVRAISDVDQKLEHEIADCLWSLLVLADKYSIDIEQAFLSTMSELETRLGNS